MKILLTVLMFAAMLGTLGTLFAGLLGFARGTDPRRGNALMRWRVVLQGLSLILAMTLIGMWRH